MKGIQKKTHFYYLMTEEDEPVVDLGCLLCQIAHTETLSETVQNWMEDA